MIKNVTTFISESANELIKKVTWPTWYELRGATIVTLVLTFLLAAYIGVLDFFISKIITFLIR